MYVIKRIDQGGGYLTRPGSQKSYTQVPGLHNIRVFKTRAEAERERCQDNEIIIDLEELIWT